MLTLRRTALASPAYRDWADYIIVEDGRDVGRLYEDRHSKTELRWFWSITVYVNPKLGLTTSGRAPSLDAAKDDCRMRYPGGARWMRSVRLRSWLLMTSPHCSGCRQTA